MRIASIPHRFWGAVITATGVALSVIHLVHLTREEPSIALLIGVLVPLGISLLLVLPLGVALLTSSMGISTPKKRLILDLGPWLAGWMVFGILWMLVAGTGTIVYEMAEDATLSHTPYLLAIFATYGTVPGLVTGYFYGQAIEERQTAADREKQLAVFSRILRHNFRNKMNVLLGEAQQIVATGSPSMTQHAEQILEAGNQLMTTVENERFLVEIVVNPVPPVTHDLSAIVDTAADAVHSAQPHAVIDVEHGTTVHVSAHPEIARAFEELLENAIIYDGSGTPRVEITTSLTEDVADVVILDTGPGIPTVETETLRDDVSVSSLDHGSGLGLRIAYRLIEESNGRLLFDSNRDDGTSVTVELPISE